MRLAKLNFSVSILVLFSAIAQAGIAPVTTRDRQFLQGRNSQVDVTPLVRFASLHTYRLSKPKTIYNWAYQPEFRALNLSVDPRGLQYAQQGASSYWRGQFGAPNNSSQFGQGLYFSKDPISSAIFGVSPRGKLDGWVLLQLTIPTSINIFDIEDDKESPGSPTSTDQELNNILIALGCADAVTDPSSGSLAARLMRPKQSSAPTCTAAIHKIFTELNPVDLFVYHWTAFNFRECAVQNRGFGQEAFVLTDGSWLRPEFVRLFDPATKDAQESRQMIQAIFDRTNDELLKTSAANANSLTSPIRQLWPDISGKSVDPQQLQNYLQSANFRCSHESVYQSK